MESIHEIEIFINIALQSLGSWIQAPSAWVSFLGTEQFYLLIMPVLYWCVDAGLGLRIGLILTISSSLNGMLKLAFHTPRPYWIDPRVHAYATESTFGLPSGHAQNAAAIWGLAGFLSKRRRLAWVCALVIFLIGLSRLTLGVHYLTDVLAGWGVGGLILFLFVRLDRPVLSWVQRQSTRKLIVFCTASSLAAVLLILGIYQTLSAWQMPASWVSGAAAADNGFTNPRSVEWAFSMGGIWLGLTCGAVWVFRSLGGFTPRGGLQPRAVSYLVGLAGVLVFWYGLGAVFPRNEDWISYGLRYFRYALVGGWVSAGGPWLFKRLGLVK